MYLYPRLKIWPEAPPPWTMGISYFSETELAGIVIALIVVGFQLELVGFAPHLHAAGPVDGVNSHGVGVHVELPLTGVLPRQGHSGAQHNRVLGGPRRSRPDHQADHEQADPPAQYTKSPHGLSLLCPRCWRSHDAL